MSCRSTPGGKAASSCATALSGGSADLASRLMHEMRVHHATADPGAVAPSQNEVIDALDRLAHLVRHDPRVPSGRKQRALSRVADAVSAYRDGADLPDRATLRAWQDLPAAMEADMLIGEPVRTSRVGEDRIPGTWDLPVPRSEALPYHRRFTTFEQPILDATDTLFRSRPSRLSLNDAATAFHGWLSSVSAHYQVPTPSLEWEPSVILAGGGVYTPDDSRIQMSHVSVTTLLHEYRHHQQFAGAPMCSPDVEEDARAWSLSLYARVRPSLFDRMVREGRILHISAQDLD